MLKLQKFEQVLLFLTLLMLPTQLGRHFWPEFSFIYSLPIDYLSPTIYFWDLLVLGLLTVWLLRGPKINWWAFNLLLIFLLTQTASLVGAANLGAGLVRLGQYILAGGFGLYIASSKLQSQTSKLYVPLALAIIFESVLAILQFIKGGTLGFWVLGERTFSISTPAIAKFDFYGREFLRPYATFPHPNVLAAFLVIILLLLSFLRPLFKWIPAFAGMTILLTVSRAVILAGIFSALILLNKKWKVLFLVILIILSPVIYTRFSAVFNFDSLSLIRREELAEVAFKMFLSSPIFGVGLNNFIPAVSDQLLVGPSRFLQPVHNIFLLSLTETGLLGMLGLLGLLGYPIWCLSRLRTTNYKLRTLLLAWAVIIFLGMFDHYFLTLPQGYRLLFLIWGFSMSMVKY